jgi:hypothetical protein
MALALVCGPRNPFRIGKNADILPTRRTVTHRHFAAQDNTIAGLHAKLNDIVITAERTGEGEATAWERSPGGKRTRVDRAPTRGCRGGEMTGADEMSPQR